MSGAWTRLRDVLTDLVTRRTVLLLVAGVVVTGLAAVGLSRLQMRTGDDTLISSSSDIYQTNQRYQREFGGENVLILLTGDRSAILSPANLESLQSMERGLQELPGVRSVMGPGTLLALANGSPAAVNALADTSKSDGRLALLFPDSRHALVVVRLEGNSTIEEQGTTVAAVDRLVRSHPLAGADALVSGTPALGSAIKDSMVQDIRRIVVLAVVLMTVVLFLVFRARWRLLSLPLALVGVLWTLGVMGLVGMPLSVVTMAGLPILIGLGVDYGVQFHNRFEEEIRRQGSRQEAMAVALTHIAPAVGIAVLCTAAGFVALLLSAVPMVRDFGIQLAVGVVLLYGLALFLLSSLLFRTEHRVFNHGTGDEGSPRLDRVLRWAARTAISHPAPILLVALTAAGTGLYFDGRIKLETDIERLMPQNSPALRDLRSVRAVVGGTSEVDVLVEGDDLSNPLVLHWMLSYEQQQRARHPEIVSSASPASLISGPDGRLPDRPVEALAGLPASSRGSVLSESGRLASISFIVRPMPAAALDRLVRSMTADLRDAPPGVSAAPAGRYAVLARSMSSLTQDRGLVTLAALAAVVAGLLLVYRSLLRAAAPVLPILLVVGWSSALMYLTGVTLNPLTAVLGSLIIGIGVEFTVLLMERYSEEKRLGKEPAAAMELAVGRIGRAITASGLTVLAGFAALLLSDFPMLRDFGMVAVTDLFLSLVSTLVVLPPVVVWVDTRTPASTAVVNRMGGRHVARLRACASTRIRIFR
ncbi:MAG: RND family transporter [Dehalococcoidia bacterium]|nr:MAG: RND family transporter [Dehalococcoidia bacterium]